MNSHADWHVEFLSDALPQTPLPGTVYIDIGQQLCPGIIDHHQSGAPTCAAKEILKHPEFVRDHLLGLCADRGQPIHTLSTPLSYCLRTHVQPDWDAILACYFAVRIMEDGEITEHMHCLANEALEWDQGLASIDVELQELSPALLYAFAQIDYDDDGDKLYFGFRMLDFLCNSPTRAEKNAAQPCRATYETHAELGEIVRRIDADRNEYQRDLENGCMSSLDLPCAGGKQRAAQTLIMRETPKSRLFKHWARSIGVSEKNGLNNRIDCLVVPYDLQDTSASGAGAHFGRVVISVKGNSGLSLKELGRALEQKEQAMRVEKGVTQSGPPRYPEISPSPDPWYDGRGHSYTIVDSPRSGTLLRYEQIVACVCQSAIHVAP